MGRCPCFGSRKKGKGKSLNDQEEEKNNLKSVETPSSGRSVGTFSQYVSLIFNY
jgi:hypothetical protein